MAIVRFIDELQIEIIELLMALSIAHKTTTISFLNTENGEKAEIFLQSGNIIHAQVTHKNILKNTGEKALHSIFPWEKIICNIIPFTAPAKQTVQSDWREILFYDLKKCYEDFILEKVQKGALNLEYLNGPKLCELPKVDSLSSTTAEELKKYLAWTPHALKNSYIMNAFCNQSAYVYVCLKNDEIFKTLIPQLNELYLQLKCSLKIENEKYLKPVISVLEKDIYLIVHSFDARLHHATLLSTKEEIDLLNEVMSEISQSSILQLIEKF